MKNKYEFKNNQTSNHFLEKILTQNENNYHDELRKVN